MDYLERFLSAPMQEEIDCVKEFMFFTYGVEIPLSQLKEDATMHEARVENVGPKYPGRDRRGRAIANIF